MKLNKILLVYMNSRSKEHDLTINEVKNVLTKYNVNFKSKVRSKITKQDFRNIDLVIVAGGDGTFLKTSHFNDNVPVLGVNTDVKAKEGFFMRATRYNFDKKLIKIVRGKYKIIKLVRLEAKVDNKKVSELALNEFYLGANDPYHTSRHVLKIGNKEEYQKSSGLLVATPVGSYAWAGAAGGKKLPLSKEKFQYVVREPYSRKLTKAKLNKGILGKKDKIFVESRLDNGLLVADSVSKEYKFKDKSKIEISISSKRLSLVDV